ncbi:MAG: putative lipid II flippase FtsW [Alphaproteobacteria bacterium]|nr:putative lipid II flippase FtsW [Alphaproteobacteria bacterium]
MRFDRTDTGVFGQWWWTIDKLNLFALILLIAVGSVLVNAGSPPVAKRLDLPAFYFVNRHYVFLGLGMMVMVLASFFSPMQVRRLAVLGFACSIALMFLVPFVGEQTKGAHRWINLAGISVQPSEFMKPCFAIVMAWVCSENHRRVDFPGYRVAIGLYLLVAFLLIIQPDIGMTLTVTAMWGVQLFLAGLPMIWVMLMGVLGIGGMFAAYHFLPHVAKRIDNFLDPAAGDNYQIGRSLEAFQNGGILGRGPGEGSVKQFLPDSHTDFIFAVAGEEFGVIVCLLILGLFAFIVLRGFARVWKENDLFQLLAVCGVLTQFGIQSVINMGVAVNLFPAKGMTLPFLSYGGSSVVAIAMGMGFMLALTRRSYGRK